MSANLDLLRSTYEGKSGENVTRLLDSLTADTVWVEAEGFPYAGTYVGPDAIIANVFRRLATEWIDYTAEAANYVEEGEQIVAFGVYSGTFKASGRAMRASFAHHSTFKDGKIARMIQYVDSHMVRQAMLVG